MKGVGGAASELTFCLKNGVLSKGEGERKGAKVCEEWLGEGRRERGRERVCNEGERERNRLKSLSGDQSRAQQK